MNDAGQRPEGSLAERYPALVAQWNFQRNAPLTPKDVAPSSKKRVWWTCARGHEWEAYIFSRSRQGAGCPYCTNRRVLTGFNDLATLDPQLAKQAHGWDPSAVMARTKKKLSWRCPLGHVTEASVSARYRHQTGCTVCSRGPGRWLAKGTNDLETTHPRLAAEASGWDPTTVSDSDRTVRRWRCAAEHEWDASVSSRTSGKGNCPVCANRLIIKGVNDLASTHPEVAAEALAWDPTAFGAGSKERVEWQCADGHRWVATIESRARRGTGCRHCSGRLHGAQLNNLADRHPGIAAEALGWDPSTVAAGSTKRAAWRCADGHEWEARVLDRTQRNGDCPYCAGRQLLPGYNDLQTKHPRLAAEADGWDPTTVLPTARKRVSWRCRAANHQWTASVAARVRGSGCLVCLGKVAVAGVNDLATTHPEIALDADGWDPSTLTAGSNKTCAWICPSGHRWRAQVSSRSLNGNGCAQCGSHGFRPDSQSIVYLVVDPERRVNKIGIANVGGGRLEKHLRRGWKVFATLECSGRDARTVEKAVLLWWRDELGIPPALKDGDGWTETASAALVDAEETWTRALLEWQRLRSAPSIDGS